MYKKLISTVAITTIFGASAFAMVNYSQEELNAANNLAEKGIINNHKSDPENYNLMDNVLRQEIAAVARGVANLPKKEKCENIFSDLSATMPNNWACFNVEVLVDNDLISKNNNFRPEDKITKSEAIAMLIKAIGFNYSYNPESKYNWQEQVVTYASNMGVVENFTDYNTDATRGWIFEVADTTIKKDLEIKKKENPEKYSDEAF